MKTQLKENIFIEGFDLMPILPANFNENLIYAGKTSEIPEEIAKECVQSIFDDSFRDYIKGGVGYESFPFETAKESILSACNQPYCIIFKTNDAV